MASSTLTGAFGPPSSVRIQPGATLAEVSTEEFVHVMATNVLGVMRAVEAFGPLARPGGVIGVMSSGQGSIADNANGAKGLYRASKASLNQAMASYAGRHAGGGPAPTRRSPSRRPCRGSSTF